MPKSDLFVHSLARGLIVIKAFGEELPRMTIAEISRQTDISRAACRRLLHTLHELGYVGTDGKKFWLTPRILELGYSYLSSTQLWDFAEDYVENLVSRVHESSSISVLEGDHVYYVVRVPARRILKSPIAVGSYLPAHLTSTGRIQLAALPPEELRQRIARMGLPAYTRHSITDRDELLATIEKDREQGWSLVSQELDEALCGIAVPIMDGGGKTIAAVNITMYPDKAADAETLHEMLTALQETAQKINTTLLRKARL